MVLRGANFLAATVLRPNVSDDGLFRLYKKPVLAKIIEVTVKGYVFR